MHLCVVFYGLCAIKNWAILTFPGSNFRDVVFRFKNEKLHGVRLLKLRLIPGTLLRVVFRLVFLL